MESLARWSFRHRRLVVALWVVGVATIWGLSQLVPAHFRGGDALPHTESYAAAKLMEQEFPDQAGDVDTIVWTVQQGRVTDPAVRSRASQMLAAVGRLPHVAGVTNPYAPGGEAAISEDGRVAFASVSFDQAGDEVPKAAVTKVVDVARGFSGGTVSIDLGGYAVGQATMVINTSLTEMLAVLAAAVVLLFAFGSLLSMSLPIVSALASILPAVSLIGLLSRVQTVPSFASSLTILLILGVGIDYALFLVTRQRNGLLAGQSVEDSLVETLRSAGRSVLFAGTIVCVSLLGLYSLGVGYLSGMASSAAIGIAFAVAAAVTLLPAMLAFFGDRVLSRRHRRQLASGTVTSAGSRGWARWAGLVARRPVVFATAVTAAIVVLAIPFSSLRLGSADQGNDPANTTTRRAYDALAAGFGPGFNAPLFVVVNTPDRTSEAVARRLSATLGGTEGVAAVAPPDVSPSGRVSVLQAFPTTSPQAKETEGLLHSLRDTVIPAAVSGTGAAVSVGGFTATEVDFTDTIKSRLPLLIGVTVLLGALLVLVAFHSLLVAALTGVMNLLAIGVCFGVIVAIFQWGWFGSLLGLGKPGPIPAFLPVFLFAILFGLSMDYQVFLLGRTHEAWLHTRRNRTAVITGQVETGRVITAAGAIMVLVFLSFAAGDRLMKLFGIGLGFTVLFDAFAIRTMLVPALLHLSGPASWWLPRWLDRVVPAFGSDKSGTAHKGAPTGTPAGRLVAAPTPLPDPTEADPTEADPTEADPAEAGPTEADPTEADPAEADPAAASRR